MKSSGNRSGFDGPPNGRPTATPNSPAQRNPIGPTTSPTPIARSRPSIPRVGSSLSRPGVARHVPQILIVIGTMWLGMSSALGASTKLRAAKDYYDFGEFGRACEMLFDLRRASDLSGEDNATVLIYLGACNHILGRRAAATEAFSALLDLKPTATLDPVEFPPEMVEFFREVRASHRPPAASTSPPSEERPAHRPEPRDEVDRPPIAPARRKHKIMALAPFGLGQFQNGDTAKGSVFVALQTISLTVGVVGLALFESEKDSGGFLLGGQFADEEKAENYRRVYYGGFAAFGFLWAASAIDALVDFDDPAPVSLLPTRDGLMIGWRY